MVEIISYEMSTLRGKKGKLFPSPSSAVYIYTHRVMRSMDSFEDESKMAMIAAHQKLDRLYRFRTQSVPKAVLLDFPRYIVLHLIALAVPRLSPIRRFVVILAVPHTSVEADRKAEAER